jgi:hypothetical protein
MNKNLKSLIALILIMAFLTIIPVFADQPPDPGGGPGGGDPVGGGSPVGSGLIYLFVMGGIYGFNKLRLLIKSIKH